MTHDDQLYLRGTRTLYLVKTDSELFITISGVSANQALSINNTTWIQNIGEVRAKFLFILSFLHEKLHLGGQELFIMSRLGVNSLSLPAVFQLLKAFTDKKGWALELYLFKAKNILLAKKKLCHNHLKINVAEGFELEINCIVV